MKSILNLRLLFLFFLLIIPLAWSKQINGNYYNTKLFFLYLASSVTLLAFALNSVVIPVLNRKSKTLLFLFLFFQTIALVISPSIASAFYLFKTLAFVSLTWIFLSEQDFYNENKQKIHLLFFFACALCLSFALSDISKELFVYPDLEYTRILGSFGNVNMLTEFFVLCFPLLFFLQRHEKKIPEYLRMLLTGGWFFVVLYCQSRSSWIGLVLVVCYLLVKKISTKEFITLFVASLLFFSTQFIDKKSNTKSGKESSLSARISLYKATLEIIKENPLGIGFGAFTNEAIPYRMKQPITPYEFEFADQPHSEILKWGLQYGWLGLLTAVAFLLFLFVSLIRLKDDLLMTGFLALMPQLVFQFPFENPASILLIAIYFSLWLRKIFIFKEHRISLKIKSLLFTIGLLTLINSFLFISAIIVESQYNTDFDKTALMCKLYPINQRNCNYKNVLLLDKNKTLDFRNDLKNEINFSYFTSDLQRILPFYFQKMNNEKSLCENILIYELIYPQQKHFAPADIGYCRKYKLPIQFNNPVQFKADYRNWLEKSVF